jgi:hypothetical protein
MFSTLFDVSMEANGQNERLIVAEHQGTVALADFLAQYFLYVDFF